MTQPTLPVQPEHLGIHGGVDLDNVAQLLNLAQVEQATHTWANRYHSDVTALASYVLKLEAHIKKELHDTLAKAIEDVHQGKTVNLGDFSKYVEDEGAPKQAPVAPGGSTTANPA